MEADKSISALDKSKATAATHWRRSRYLTAFLLTSWFFLTFGILFFARELSAYTFFGWPFSFYMAAQGLTLFYVALLAIFSLWMRKIEDAYHTEISEKNPDLSQIKDSNLKDIR
ncbi:DUF4212 domain-containing protein [Undibacterium sp. RTI2.1]|uniref:DUF4212 domain-containing protein n=1 Tax=unclassified Undibacterium TaxID=2630295 RepID=UPI002AB3799B|nr:MULTISPECIES: DUF4212 domain-containing protein [unclassified Undibacterium]MDY7539093.1 DUF4212 domain-containing protein [Undibacterium sp. 5I1]MEB0030982.1 DUF4212 domain-containing protein [Undibacterium sp. RTI2.1]MEB0115829.1 DUF4212 domain-containing protein [Undibacterium sp. RTI2.2]MEB0229773.1 DUF4212 domain-containing protein [Undibacterium sp. 10I3]MEB0258322.1 DUF4212 domain-containing protein [Undibacterium sp. 5I1]